MSKYIDVDKLSEMIEARAEMLVEGKETFSTRTKYQGFMKDVLRRYGSNYE